jgi:pyridoxine 4-dehydrogenase
MWFTPHATASRGELIQAVHDNLRNLDVDVLDVVNLRNMFDEADRAGELIEAALTVLADLQRQGLVRHIGLSNVTPGQIAAGRRICDIVCVQNRYNLAHRSDDRLIDRLADDGIASMYRFSRWADLRRSSPPRSHASRDSSTPRQRKWHSRGCFVARPTCF